MNLVYVWYKYNDKDWPNILHSTIPTPYMISGSRSWTYSRIFMFKFYFKIFRSSVFTKPVMGVTRLTEIPKHY